MPHWELGKVQRLWGDHTKVKYMKVPVGSDNYWFYDILSGHCEGNQEWIKHNFYLWLD